MLELQNNTKINSIELCNKINEYRKLEGCEKTKRHDVLLRDLRNEIKALENAGINVHNFVEVTYKDAKGENRPCFELTRDGALQMLNKESAFVRYKTTEYINTLEKQVDELDYLIARSLRTDLTKEERIEIERRRAELSKERDEQSKWFNDFMDSKGSYSSTQIGKLFKIGSGQKMNKLLHENKIIFKQGKNWIPYETIDKSWYKLNVGTKNEYSYSQLKFTPKGVYELSKLLNIEFNEEDLKELA